jgi:hypothetical protein
MSEAALESEVLDLVPVDETTIGPPATLYGTRDPKTVRDKMVELADTLMDVVRTKQLAVRIRNREHLTVEAWTTLGAFVGVHAAIVWTKPNESGDGIVARAEARTIAGDLVGAAEAECSRVESKWKHSEPFAIRSMAQTRALSRALQAPLRHIAVLAGYEGTAAEELPADEPGPAEPSKPVTAPVQPTPEQTEQVKVLLRTLEHADPAIDWPARARELARIEWGKLTRSQAEHLIEQLRGELAALMPDS